MLVRCWAAGLSQTRFPHPYHNSCSPQPHPSSYMHPKANTPKGTVYRFSPPVSRLKGMCLHCAAPNQKGQEGHGSGSSQNPKKSTRNWIASVQSVSRFRVHNGTPSCMQSQKATSGQTQQAPEQKSVRLTVGCAQASRCLYAGLPPHWTTEDLPLLYGTMIFLPG